MPETSNTKILVQFRSEKVISTTAHRGSKEYKGLIDLGYREVCTIKPDPKTYFDARDTEFEVSVEVYINDDFFNPKHKYTK